MPSVEGASNRLAIAPGFDGLAISPAANDTVADAIAGFLILADRAFRIGDPIEIQEMVCPHSLLCRLYLFKPSDATHLLVFAAIDGACFQCDTRLAASAGSACIHTSCVLRGYEWMVCAGESVV